MKKKFYTFFVFILLVYSCTSQSDNKLKNFTLQGEIIDQDIGKITLQYVLEDAFVRDTAVINKGNIVNSQQIQILDLAKAIESPGKVVLSDFINNLTYIPLETNQNCLINANPEVKLSKNYIIITTPQQCMIFDRRTGSFIREIGHYGRGPGEFSSTHGFFDELGSICYFQGWNGNLLKYSLDGKFLGSLKIPQFNSTFKEPSMPGRYTCLTDQLIVCNFLNITGSEAKSLMFFNNEGEIVKIIPNKHIIKNVKQVMSTGSVSFHHFNRSVFYQEYYNDTVFRITTENITPYFVLNRGKYRPPYESLWWPLEKSKQNKLIRQPIYLEGSGYIAFDFYYLFNKDGFFALYDKKLKSLRITQNISGIRNDIDDFMDLTFKSINESDELSCLIQSEDIINWFENNKERSNSLNTVLQNLKKIGLGDNPVVVISKYKPN